jgi:hypothetical protein
MWAVLTIISNPRSKKASKKHSLKKYTSYISGKSSMVHIIEISDRMKYDTTPISYYIYVLLYIGADMKLKNLQGI